MDAFMGMAAQLLGGTVILGYLILCIFSVIWCIKLGDVGAHIQATLLAKFLFWHGVCVVGVVVLSAAGSFILLFAHLALKGFVER
jgi:hypothetical protein